MLPLAEHTLGDLLGKLGKKTPSPGGGAAAPIAGALAAALGRMVVSYSDGKPSLAEHQPLLADAAERLDRAGSLFLALADEDAAAYAELNALMKRPPEDPERRAREPGAVQAAIGAPRAALAAAGDLLRLLESLVGRSNHHLRSDLAIAAVLAEAAASSAAWNVRINLPLLTGERPRAELAAETDKALADARDRRARVERACAQE